MIYLYLIDKEEVLAHKEEIISLVDEERRKKALSHNKEDDVLRSLGIGYLYKKIIGKTPLYDAKGRPFFLEGPYVSFAHSGLYSLMGISDSPIGADIEEIRTFPEKTKRFFPSGLDNEGYYAAWCRYEAFAKCLGLGLSFPLDSPLPLKNSFEYQGKNYSLDTCLYDGHMIAIASEGDKQEIEIELVHFS